MCADLAARHLSSEATEADCVLPPIKLSESNARGKRRSGQPGINFVGNAVAAAMPEPSTPLLLAVGFPEAALSVQRKSMHSTGGAWWGLRAPRPAASRCNDRIWVGWRA